MRATRVMIVEDDPLIALDLEGTFLDAGYDVSGLARNVEEGLSLLDGDAPDVATLDYNLGTETSQALAEALDARDIPYCFISGYAAPLRKSVEDVPILAKPVAPRVVVRTVNSLIARETRH